MMLKNLFLIMIILFFISATGIRAGPNDLENGKYAVSVDNAQLEALGIPKPVIEASNKIFLLVSIKDYEIVNKKSGKKEKQKGLYWGTGFLRAPGIIQTAYHVVFHNDFSDAGEKSEKPVVYIINSVEMIGNNTFNISGYKLTIDKLERKKDIAKLKIDKFFDKMFNNDSAGNSLGANGVNDEMSKFAFPMTLTKNAPEDKIYFIGFKSFATGKWQKFIFINKVENQKSNVNDGIIEIEALVVSGLVEQGGSGGVAVNENGEVVAMIVRVLGDGKIASILINEE